MALDGQLLVQLEGRVVQALSLSKPSLTIGRLPDNDLALSSPQVSPRHAEIRLEKEGPVLTDTGSAHGTFINGRRILLHQPHLLADGEAFRIGPYTIIYRSAEATEHTIPSTVDEPREAERPQREQALQADDTASAVVPLSTPMKPSRPMPVPKDSATSSYASYLPVIFHENDFLHRFLMIFETLWEPLEQRQDHIAMYFDPRTCPAALLPWLASWLDLQDTAHWSEGRLRSLLADAVELYAWRGTKYGLTRMIEVCTGLTAEITEVTEQPFVFRITLSSPADGHVDQALIDELIRTHKPAHAGYILEVQV